MAGSPGAPVRHGFAATRLAALTRVIQDSIDTGMIPGSVMLIARNGEIAYEKALGQQDPQAGISMSVDSIFRIYSMTKPIVSVAVMMLVEEGELMISDPVSKYFPELANPKVGVEKTGPDGKRALELVPAEREMTVQDLLRHTSGLTYGLFGESLVKKEYIRSGIERKNISNSELANKLAQLPLAYQPGTTWEYGRSTDLLGALLERVCGTTLDVVLDERILRPLNMTDTGFWVKPGQQHRLAEAFTNAPGSGKSVKLLNVADKPIFLSGGGGLVSTVRDYLRFASMLLNQGELDGIRIVSRKTLQFMTSDHLVDMPQAKAGADYLPGPGCGFGLGFAVRTSNGAAIVPGSVGDYTWSGLAGTSFWVDPQEKMIAIWMMQAPEQRNYFRQLYRNLVYAAIE
ncbi:MAG TPA: serine hydrolase domain-containing protein [Burkholderiaceae bacterium]|nr:serine hydrolase domain-containing protein [Burkholderiaceae bacterium]